MLRGQVSHEIESLGYHEPVVDASTITWRSGHCIKQNKQKVNIVKSNYSLSVCE